MWQEFKAFLIKQNMLALALAVVIGVATNTVVQSLVDGLIMPIVGLMLPGGAWQEFQVSLGSPVVGPDGTTTQNALQIGSILGALINFLIVALVVWQITNLVIRPAPDDPKPATVPCPHCRQQIDAAATRCAYCTSALGATVETALPR